MSDGVEVEGVKMLCPESTRLGVLLVESLGGLWEEAPPHSLCICLQGVEVLP